ncbi:MAG: hypothetical protein UT32_C0020G0016 [Parcubacteria group bacterium GW2011_GWC2_39_14]|nr:MAG: hypothetical protein UT32_C0020G0016 [Parcubacteria group bacterium GW2011_GWC2_39_14]KKR54129.1 MAG: hypothetical protein UT91_C0020G0016 [Parcubacteria group bacterium GW2011_GWA2_40_23]
MEGKEPESKYLVLWLCVFLTAGIIFVGWFISLRTNFNKINAEMNGNVTQTFEQAQQEVFDSFDEVQGVLEKSESTLGAGTAVTVTPEVFGAAVGTEVAPSGEKVEVAPVQ